MQNSSDRWRKPLTLSGQHVTLEPLEVEHAAALADAACENGGALALVVRDNRSTKHRFDTLL